MSGSKFEAFDILKNLDVLTENKKIKWVKYYNCVVSEDINGFVFCLEKSADSYSLYIRDGLVLDEIFIGLWTPDGPLKILWDMRGPSKTYNEFKASLTPEKSSGSSAGYLICKKIFEESNDFILRNDFEIVRFASKKLEEFVKNK